MQRKVIPKTSALSRWFQYSVNYISINGIPKKERFCDSNTLYDLVIAGDEEGSFVLPKP